MHFERYRRGLDWFTSSEARAIRVETERKCRRTVCDEIDPEQLRRDKGSTLPNPVELLLQRRRFARHMGERAGMPLRPLSEITLDVHWAWNHAGDAVSKRLDEILWNRHAERS